MQFIVLVVAVNPCCSQAMIKLSDDPSKKHPLFKCHAFGYNNLYIDEMLNEAREARHCGLVEAKSGGKTGLVQGGLAHLAGDTSKPSAGEA